MKKLLKKISAAVRNLFAGDPPVEEKSLAEKVEDIIKAQDALEK